MIVSVLLSMVYAMARAMFGLLVLRGRGEPAKDIELLVLRHEVMGCVVRSVVRSLDQRPPLARLERTEVGSGRYRYRASRRARRPDTRVPPRGLIIGEGGSHHMIEVLEPHRRLPRRAHRLRWAYLSLLLGLCLEALAVALGRVR
jgi:hypothetical protein